MKRLFTSLCLAATASLCVAAPLAPAAPVKLTVDAARVTGPMTPIWAWFGYDEPNYTYSWEGKKLLTELAELSDGRHFKVPLLAS